ncbi:MAG: alpha/beta hydrolase [Chloroflexi bacterium]|nr:alpha/beta hydrolase [Chloroflexota bacterium]
MKKWILGIGLAVLVIGIVAGVFIWRSFGEPLYTPGMVSAGENLRAPLTPPQQSGAEDFWQVEPDIELHHFAAGEGRNVVVVHGGPGMPYVEAWPGLEPLTGDYRFHYYDQRGSGLSTRPITSFDSANYYENLTTLDQTLGLGAQIADIERIRQILGEEKLILIGHSFGGFIASLYAAEFPEHVEALILVAPATLLVMPIEGDDLFGSVRELLLPEQLADYDAYIESYFDFSDLFSNTEEDLIALNAGFGEFYAQVVDLPMVEMEQGQPGGWMVQAMYFSMGQRHDYRPALAKVSAPVLVIHGENDMQTEAQSRVYTEAFPNAEFQVIADTTHFPFYEQTESFASIVQAFLADINN